MNWMNSQRSGLIQYMYADSFFCQSEFPRGIQNPRIFFRQYMYMQVVVYTVSWVNIYIYIHTLPTTFYQNSSFSDPLIQPPRVLGTSNGTSKQDAEYCLPKSTSLSIYIPGNQHGIGRQRFWLEDDQSFQNAGVLQVSWKNFSLFSTHGYKR